jgi:hypothetical protein
MSNVYFGVVEDRLDPLMLGRCRVRVVGKHTENKEELPTDMLPWAYPVMPINNASMNGIGWSPTGVVTGTWVVIIFVDEYEQQPLMLGSVGGIPQTLSAQLYTEAHNEVIFTDENGILGTTSGNPNAAAEVEKTAGKVMDLVNGIVSEESNLDETMPDSVYQLINSTNQTLGINEWRIVEKEGNGDIVASGTYDTDLTSYVLHLETPAQWSADKQSLFEQPVDGKQSKYFFAPDGDNAMLMFFNQNFKPSDKIVPTTDRQATQ